MPTLNIPSLLIALALSLGMAILGGLLTGNQLTRWFATLQEPRLQLPLWAFVGVGVIGYVFDTIIAYRLLTEVPDQTDRIIALTALVVVMLYNELWNIVLFRWQNTFAGFLGVLAFLAPLLILQVTLFLVETISAVLVLIYVVWVIGYDIPWSYTLWRLNPPEREQVSRERTQVEDKS
jgi:benzodiazapine receptor